MTNDKHPTPWSVLHRDGQPSIIYNAKTECLLITGRELADRIVAAVNAMEEICKLGFRALDMDEDIDTLLGIADDYERAVNNATDQLAR